MAGVVDDVPRVFEITPSEGLGMAKHSTGAHATPHRWACLGHTRLSTARQSFEWETETLLDQSSGSLDGETAFYSCPFRKRNPARFNIRDHESCALAPFGSILGLK